MTLQAFDRQTNEVKTMKLVAILLVLLAVPAVHAQSQQDESAVTQVAVTELANAIFPYVEHWVIASTTESLEPGMQQTWFDQARADYVKRNGSPATIGGLTLPKRATVASLAQFGSGLQFNWAAFEKQYPEPNTYTMLLSRPGFSDESHAVIRVNIWNRTKSEPATGAIPLEKTNGQWKVTGGEFPAIR